LKLVLGAYAPVEKQNIVETYVVLVAVPVLLVASWSCDRLKGPELAEPYSNPRLVKQVVAAMPHGWSLAETLEDQIPRGHHLSDGYKGHGGTKVVLVGPTPVYLHWRDQGGSWHDDALAKESVELYVMPPEYRQGWSGFDAPIPADLVVANQVTRIYGLATHHLNSESEFDRLLQRATVTSWPISPHSGTMSLSWETWKTDVSRAVGGG
jgi:hypothetical protein